MKQEYSRNGFRIKSEIILKWGNHSKQEVQVIESKYNCLSKPHTIRCPKEVDISTPFNLLGKKSLVILGKTVCAVTVPG